VTNVLKITTVGNSVGLVLPKDILAKLLVSKGDSIFAIETPNGIELTPYDPVIARQMEVAERVMRKHRNVLKTLAK
jgi:putative addiction module antidote